MLGLGFFLILGSSHASEITVGDVSHSAYLPYFNVGSWKVSKRKPNEGRGQVQPLRYTIGWKWEKRTVPGRSGEKPPIEKPPISTSKQSRIQQGCHAGTENGRIGNAPDPLPQSPSKEMAFSKFYR